MSQQVVALIGTRRGLFRAVSDDARLKWTVEGPAIAGYEVYHAILDPHDVSTGYAAVRHEVWGAHIYASDDAGGSWTSLASAPEHPAESGRPDSARTASHW